MYAPSIRRAILRARIARRAACYPRPPLRFQSTGPVNSPSTVEDSDTPPTSPSQPSSSSSPVSEVSSEARHLAEVPIDESVLSPETIVAQKNPNDHVASLGDFLDVLSAPRSSSGLAPKEALTTYSRLKTWSQASLASELASAPTRLAILHVQNAPDLPTFLAAIYEVERRFGRLRDFWITTDMDDPTRCLREAHLTFASPDSADNIRAHANTDGSAFGLGTPTTNQARAQSAYAFAFATGRWDPTQRLGGGVALEDLNPWLRQAAYEGVTDAGLIPPAADAVRVEGEAEAVPAAAAEIEEELELEAEMLADVSAASEADVIENVEALLAETHDSAPALRPEVEVVCRLEVLGEHNAHRFIEPVGKQRLLKEPKTRRDVRERIARSLIAWGGFYPSYAFSAEPPVERTARDDLDAKLMDESVQVAHEAARSEAGSDALPSVNSESISTRRIENASPPSISSPSTTSEAEAEATDPVTRATAAMRDALIQQRLYLRNVDAPEHGLLAIGGRTYVQEWLTKDALLALHRTNVKSQARRGGNGSVRDEKDERTFAEFCRQIGVNVNLPLDLNSTFSFPVPASAPAPASTPSADPAHSSAEDEVQEAPRYPLSDDEAAAFERMRARMAKSSPVVADKLRKERERARQEEAEAARVAREVLRATQEVATAPSALNRDTTVSASASAAKRDTTGSAARQPHSPDAQPRPDKDVGHPTTLAQKKSGKRKGHEQNFRDRLLGWVRNL